MNKIIEVLKLKRNLFTLKGASEQDIEQAEEQLGVIFADDYKELLKEYGVVSYDGHEIVGICSSARLNVVNVTTDEKNNNLEIPEDWYVIEVANIDSIVIWQSGNGEIYKTSTESEPAKLCDSLIEYVSIKTGFDLRRKGEKYD